MLKTAIAKAGYTDKVVIGMDVAASEFYNEKDKLYDLNFKEDVSNILVWNIVCQGITHYWLQIGFRKGHLAESV